MSVDATAEGTTSASGPGIFLKAHNKGSILISWYIKGRQVNNIQRKFVVLCNEQA